MIKKYKYLIFFSFLFLLNAGFCFARLEVQIPGLPQNPTLIDYRNVIFTFLIGIGGILAVFSLVLGGIGYITSAGNPESRSNAKKRVTSAIFGLVLLVSSYIIIQRINPKLISPEMAGLPVIGVYFVDGQDSSGRDITTPYSPNVPDTNTLLEKGYNRIRYVCQEGIYNPDLWITYLEKSNGIPIPKRVLETMCGSADSPQEMSIPPNQSLVIDFRKPGLYLYNDQVTRMDGPTKPRSSQILASQNQMDENYLRKTKSARIINDTTGEKYYGVLFHSEINYRGTCSLDPSNYVYFVPKASEEEYFSVPSGISSRSSSFDFFQWNDNASTSGDGATFYSQPFGTTKGVKAGYKNIQPVSQPIVTENPQDIVFDYAETGIPPEEQNLCHDFKACPGSIDIKGKYLVVLYATGGYCQVFYTSNEASNLNVAWVLKEAGGRTLTKVVIVALKP
jgi:hypothetical protein